MANVRLRGKIPHEEWPKIMERYQRGETLTEIARAYNCTAPAIRYIIGRMPAAKKGSASDKPPVGAAERKIGKPSARHIAGRLPASAFPSTAGVGSRMNSEVVAFLGALEAVSSDDSDENYEKLLMATDRLLWGSARTRLEIEEILRNRRERVAARRASG